MRMGHCRPTSKINTSTTPPSLPIVTRIRNCGDDNHQSSKHIHEVPCYASFFEVADPSMDFTNEEPSFTIPKTFVKRFKAYLSTNNIKLESPCGRIWNACLEAKQSKTGHSDHESSLKITTGWKEFACYMEIQSGDLIIFDLVSKCHFKVYIYEGEDSCEKDIYSKSMLAIKGTSNEKEIDSDKDPRLNGSGIISAQMRKLNAFNDGLSISSSITNNCHPAKKLKRDTNGDRMGQILHIIPSIHNEFKFNKSLLTLDDFWKVWIHFHTETQKAFKDAIAFISSNPFTIILMCHSNVCHGFKLSFPRRFASRHLSKYTEEVTLLDKDNKAWTITWLGSESSEYSLSGGWKYFVVDHNLRCGDICIFELLPMKENIIVFRIHIFKVSPSDVVAIRDTIPTKFSKVLEIDSSKVSNELDIEDV